MTKEGNPLLNGGLPDWLADVPINAAKPVLVPFSQNRSVPLSMVMGALQTEVGTTIGSFAIAPSLADQFAQFTENPAWKNLPKEPTSITRIADDIWEVSVGDYSESFNRNELTARIKGSLDKETPKND